MGVSRTKVAAVATITFVAALAACAPADEGGASPTALASVDADGGPGATPTLEALENARPTIGAEPSIAAEPGTGTDGDDGGYGDDGGDEPSGPSTWAYRYVPTEGYPTYFPEVLPPTNDDGTVGSGCTPPDSDTLPDGIWRAYLVEKSYREWPAWATFDILCSYSFQYPNPPEDVLDSGYGDRLGWDYILTNTDTREWRLPVAADAIGYGRSWNWAPTTWDQVWLGCGPCPTWVYVNDGEITELAWPYDLSGSELDRWRNENS